MRLTEEEIRRKAVELLNGMDLARMDAWMISGTFAGVFDEATVTRILHEEVQKLDPHVRSWWLEEPCTCGNLALHDISLN